MYFQYLSSYFSVLNSTATSESKFEQQSKYQRPQLPITYYATMLNPMSNGKNYPAGSLRVVESAQQILCISRTDPKSWIQILPVSEAFKICIPILWLGRIFIQKICEHFD
ncbi:unnamed protein product [Natator depressus]